MLTKEDFEKAADQQAKVEKHQLTELHGECYLRVLNGRERDAYDASVFDGATRNVDNLSARLLAVCLCDDKGKPLFDNPTAGAAKIGRLPSPIVERLFNVARKLNGMGADNVEELAKNSDATTGAGSYID